MSARRLAELGQAAFKPQLVEGVWRKAVISAKNAARLRKQTLLEGRHALFPTSIQRSSLIATVSHIPFQNREWPYDPTPSPTTATTKKPPRQKGHKVDKTKPERLAKIEANLKDMDEKIAKHREARRTRLDKLPYIDRMLLSPKQQREKLKAMQSV